MKVAESQTRVKIGLFTKITCFVFMIIGMLFPINPGIITKSLAAPLVGTTYFVNGTNGSDSNVGTETQPWKTIQKCLNQAQAGNTCEVYGGTYSETLTLKISGTQTARITLRNHNNDIVTVNSGSSQTLVTGGRIHYYTIEGLRFIATYTSPGQGDYTIDFGKNIWDGETTKDGGNNGFILRDCYIEGAVRFYGHNNLVENCELNGKQNWTNGLQDRYGTSYDNVYRQNVVHDYKMRGLWTMQYTDNILIENNTTYNNGEMGIDCDGAAHPVTNCIVRNNIIHDITGEGVGILLENSFDSTIDGNMISNVIDGIKTINYGGDDPTGQYFVSDADYLTYNTNTIFSNNIIYNIKKAGIRCLSSPGGKALHNTIYKTTQDTSIGFLGGIALQDYRSSYCHNWEIKDNIIAQSRLSALWFKAPSNGLNNIGVDNNLYDFGLTDAKFKWEQGSSSLNYTLSQMQNQKNLELNSFLGNPLFVNPSNQDFYLQTGSPAIDVGSNVGISIDLAGNLRPQGAGFDIGAYEFGNQTQPTLTNTPLPTATNTPLPTSTKTPLPTSTNTPLSTSTNTPLPTATNTPLSTSTKTLLPTATNTPLSTSTKTPLPTATNTPLQTSTKTPMPTSVSTSSPTPINIPTQTLTVPDNPTSTPATCNSDEIGTNQLIGCIYKGTDFETLSGPAPSGNVVSSTVTDTTTILDYNWGLSAPNGFVGEDNFSAKWKGNFTFSQGIYTFTVGSDDGIRVKVNGITIVDAWRLQEFTTQTFTQSFSTQTTVPIEVEYFEKAIEARVQISWTYEPSTIDQPISLSWQAEDGIISYPFLVNNGYIYQSQTTDISNGGEARYPFTITVLGDYTIQARVNAPTDGNNSFFVNIDEQPTDPTMIWDVGVTSGFETQLVSWRGNGTSDQNQYSPKVFTLGTGSYELIIRGREANTQLDTISIILVDSALVSIDTPRLFQIYLPMIISP